MDIQFSESGLSISLHKTHPVKHFARPQSQRQCQEFLGLCNWFRRWIPGHATIAQPITALTQRDCKFHWSPSCEAAFLKLKELFCNSSVLRFAQLDLPFTLICESNLSGIGYTLCQGQGHVNIKGNFYAIEYGSRALTKAERLYSASEIEFFYLCVGYQTMKKLSDQSLLSFFETDHKCLIYLKNFTTNNI